MIIGVVVLTLVISFGGVLLFGAPYLPTLSPQVTIALDLAALRPGERLIELGCGDGKVLVAAAQRGLQVTGYELNPLLAAVCWLRTRRYHSQVTVKCGNFWRSSWPPAEAIFTFLLPRYMDKLNKKIIQYNHKPVKLVSFAFVIPSKSTLISQSGVHVYEYL